MDQAELLLCTTLWECLTLVRFQYQMSLFPACVWTSESTVEPLYQGHFGTLVLVLIAEVSSFQRSLDTLQYYAGVRNGVLITEVSAIQRFAIEWFHCTHILPNVNYFLSLIDLLATLTVIKFEMKWID